MFPHQRAFYFRLSINSPFNVNFNRKTLRIYCAAISRRWYAHLASTQNRSSPVILNTCNFQVSHESAAFCSVGISNHLDHRIFIFIHSFQYQNHMHWMTSEVLNIEWLKKSPEKKPTKKSGCEIGIAFGEIRTVILNKCMCAFNRWANVCVILESPFFDFDAHKGVWIHFISSWVSNCECVVVFSYSNLVVPSFYCCCFFLSSLSSPSSVVNVVAVLFFCSFVRFVRFLSLLLHHIDMTSSE